MSVDITQEEMNILNLNGISAEDVRANVEYSRATGLDDETIRQNFTNTLQTLKPLTPQSAKDSGNIKEWQSKGAIAPFEKAKRDSIEFDGTYNNVLSKEQQRKEFDEKHPLLKKWNESTENRIENGKREKAERDKRVNEGTASFFDRVTSALERGADASLDAQINAPQDFTAKRVGLKEDMSGFNKPDTSEKIDFSESLANSFISGSWIPFAGGFVSKADTKKQREIQEKIKNNEPIRQDELNFLNYQLKKQQEESVRGYTFGGSVAKDFLPSLIRFGTEIATGSWLLKSWGLAPELAEGASLGEKVAHGTQSMLTSGAVNTLLPTGWNDIYDVYQDRMLRNELDTTDKGKYIFKESNEKPAIAFLKSLGQTFVMFASESSGELLHIPMQGVSSATTKYVGTPISQYLKSNKTVSEFVKKITPELSKLYEKMNNLPIKGQTAEWLKSRVKYDGFLEELGEEVVEDVLNLTIGTNNEERSLENYAKAIFKSPDEWAILAGAVALQGGTLSVASHLLGSHLEQNGASDEQIVDILKTLSENDKEQIVESLISDGLINVDETSEERIEKNISAVADSFMQSGKVETREQAEKIARLGVNMLTTLSEKTGKSAEDLIQEDMADIENVDQEAYVDANGVFHTGVVQNEEEKQPETISERINSLVDEFSNLPDDYDDMDKINEMIDAIDILEKISSSNLSIEDMEKANDYIAKLEENGDSQFANYLKDVLNNPESHPQHFQRSEFAGAESSAEYLDAKKEWDEKGTESKYFKKFSNDAPFVTTTNAVNYEFKTGEKVVVEAYHGTNQNLSEFDYLKRGASTNSKSAKAGFWFVDNETTADSYADFASTEQPINELQRELEKAERKQDWDKFDELTRQIEEIQFELIEKTPSDRGAKTYKVFVKFSNPYVFDAENKMFMDIQSEINDVIQHAKENNYDGVIIKNLKDKPIEGEYGEQTPDTHYLAFENTQIKSVNNQGTFDSNNPNIYYQREIKKIYNMLQDMFSKKDSIKVSELFDKNPILNPLKNYYKDVLETTYIKKSPEWMAGNNEYGAYINVSKTIFLNPKAMQIYPNSEQWFYRTLLHELTHAKQHYLLDYAKKNVKNKNISANDKKALKQYIEVFKKSDREKLEDTIFKIFNSPDKIKKSKELSKKRNALYNVYKHSELERDADNVSLALQYYIGNTMDNSNLKDYLSIIFASESKGKRSTNNVKIAQIRAFNERRNFENARGISRLSDLVNTKTYYQRANRDNLNSNIESNFDDTAENITSYIKQDVMNILADNDVDESEFNFEDIRIFGSYSTSTNKATSDLDILVQYSGSMREDDAFNMFADEELYITDKNGRKVRIDINPINTSDSGTIDEYLDYVDNLDNRVLYQSAYHGTPHKFDEFSTDAIGTGEGAQAHGWGLYFAGDKNVSEKYRKKLKGTPKVEYNGETKDYDSDNFTSMLYRLKTKGLEETKNFYKEKEEEFREQAKTSQNPDWWNNDANEFKNIYENIIDTIDIDKINVHQGQLYEVDIPENDELLDEQKTFEEQSKTIQKAFLKLAKEFDIKVKGQIQAGVNFHDITGKYVYNKLAGKLGSAREASLYLNQLGVKGIKYDGKQDGECYVVFDDKAIKVLKRYYQKQKQQRAKQTKLLIDNEQANIISNRIEKIKGSFIPAENLIKLFKDADETTIVHEFAHWWLEKLVKYSEENEEVQADLIEIRKFVKNNGEPFTDEQHERFARGFEAYIRTGSAKTNRLKKLFEDFKNALLSLYDSIKSLGFDEEEIPEINNLFERLLTTETQRIQTAVFERCNNLQAQIQTIRDNQENELAEIDEIVSANLERNAQDNRRKQQVQEYLRLAKNSAYKVPKEVREIKERYKKATLDILSVASGKPRQWVGNSRNWEQLYDLIDGADDKITTSGGFRQEWSEFYSDTGVSYENDEIDGDAKLAMQAYKVMVDGNYNFNQFISEYDDAEFNEFFKMFEYLVAKVKTTRGENKDSAMDALSELFDKIPAMPDEFMQEIVSKMNEVSETYVEDKINEKPTKKSIANVSLGIQLRSYVVNKLHNMKAYDPESKRNIRLSEVNKLYRMLKYADTVQNAKEIIRQINAHAITQLENRQKHILHKEIQKQIKINSKLIKVGALKQGKFDWKTNTIFQQLVEMNRLPIEDARKEFAKLTHADEVVMGEERDSAEENPTGSLDAPTDFQAVLKTKFLEYKANKTNDLNLLATRSLLEDIIELKFEGRRAKNEEELKKALSRYNYENNLIAILSDNNYSAKAKYIARWVAGDTMFTSEGTLANWESLLNAVFDSKTAKKYSLLKLESDAENYAHRKCAEFYNKALDIYGLKPVNQGTMNKAKNLFDKALDFDMIQPLVRLFNEYENEVQVYKQITWNKDTNKFVETSVELTKNQLITLYAWSLNPQLKQRLVVQFGGDEREDGELSRGEIQLEQMFSLLSDADKNFAWAMIDICDSMYDDSNEVFIRTTGLSLPRCENYIPSKTERVGSDIDMLHEFVVRSTNPSFIKERKNCSRIKMDPQSPLAIILPHINKTARYVVLSETVNFYNRIFASNDIQAKLIEMYGKKSGKKIHQVILNQLATSTYTNYARSITVGKSLLDKVADNFITSSIGGNLKVMFSQLTSVINYSEHMPVAEWGAGFVGAISNPKKTIDFMFKNCEYLQTRLAGNSMNEIMASLTDETDKFRSIKNFCTSNTKYGDIIAIMFGGKPYVDYLMKQGMSKEDAFNTFVEDTLRSQQSGHNSATSAWQKKQREHWLSRMFFAFNNTNLQYERKWVDAISQHVKGEIDKKEFAKAFIIYKVFNPILFTSFLGNLSIMTLFRGLFGGDDDAIIGSFKDMGMAVLLSNLKGYGGLGVIAQALLSIVYASFSKDKYMKNSLPLISDMEDITQTALKDSKSFADYIKILCTVGDYTTGAPMTRTSNFVGGIGDVAQGNAGVGALRMIGYGNYRATLVATGKPPKKKKK